MNYSTYFDPTAHKAGYCQMSDPEYRAIQAINSSLLKEPTTLEAYYALRKEFEPLRACLMQGSLVDRAILEPDIWDSAKRDEWLIVVSTLTLDSKEARAAYEANPNHVIATSRMVEKAARAKEAVYRHAQARWMLNQPRDTKAVGLAFDEECCVWRKTQLDIKPKDDGAGWLADLKTTSASVSSKWALDGEVRKWGHDISARHYSEVHEQITGKQVTHFAFLWVQGPWALSADAKDAPFIARLTALDREPDATPSLLTVQPTYRDRLGKLCNAFATNQFEAHEHETISIGLPF